MVTPRMAALVWVLDFARRPWPQLWQEFRLGVDGHRKEQIIAVVHLKPEDANLSLDELAVKYPAPAVPEVA